MIKRVIYISYTPFIPKMREDFYFDNLINANVEFEYWDLSALYFPKVYQNKTNTTNWEKQFCSYSELKYAIKQKIKSENVLFILLTTYNFRVIYLYRYLTKYRCKIGFFARWMLPYPEKTKKDKIKKNLFTKNIFRNALFLLKVSISYFVKKYRYIKPYDLVFCGGSEGYKTIGVGAEMDLKSAIIKKISSFDFEKFKAIGNYTNNIEEKYAIFLDEYLPYHPDFNLLGVKTVNPDNYFSQLNIFFCKIEQKHKVKIRIAAHPKAELYKTDNPFLGREVIYGKTCELVKDCEFVIAHMSSSISFPVLYQKCILFVSTINIQKEMPNQHEYILHFANILNSKVFIIDETVDINWDSNIIDKKAYNEYKYKYLTSYESENKLSSEIFIETISQL